MITLLASIRDGVARAIRGDDGAWTVDVTLRGSDVRCLVVDPMNEGALYAGTQGHGVLRSGDFAQTWQPMGLDGRIVKSLACSRLERGTMYAGTKPAAMFVSRDGGRQWTELLGFRKIPSRRFWFSPAEPPFTAYVQGIALSPVDPGVILAGIELGAVVRSADDGNTWTDHRRGALRDCHSIAFHSTNGAWAYEAGGTGAGAAYSRDAGQNWTQPKAGLDRRYGWACASHPTRPEVWYVSASPGPAKAHSAGKAKAHIFRAGEDGVWTKLSNDLPQPLNHLPYALLTDSSAPEHLYAGLGNGDVWHSDNRGDSWRKLPFNLGGQLRSLVILNG